MKINKILAAGVAATLAVTSASIVTSAETQTRAFDLEYSIGKITYNASIVGGSDVDVKPIEDHFAFKKIPATTDQATGITTVPEKAAWDYAVKNVYDTEYKQFDAFVPFWVEGTTTDVESKLSNVTVRIYGTKYDNGNTKEVGNKSEEEYKLVAGTTIDNINGKAITANDKKHLFILPIYSGLTNYQGSFNPGEYNSIDRIVIKYTVSDSTGYSYETEDEIEYKSLLTKDEAAAQGKAAAKAYAYQIKSTTKDGVTTKAIEGGLAATAADVGPAVAADNIAAGEQLKGTVKLWEDVTGNKAYASGVVFYTVDPLKSVMGGNGVCTSVTAIPGIAAEAVDATDTLDEIDAYKINEAITAAKTFANSLAATTAATAGNVTAVKNLAKLTAADAAATKYNDEATYKAATVDPVKKVLVPEAIVAKAGGTLKTIETLLDDNGLTDAEKKTAAYKNAEETFERVLKAIGKAVIGGVERTGAENKANELFYKFQKLFDTGYAVEWIAMTRGESTKFAWLPVTNDEDHVFLRDEIWELSTTRDYESISYATAFSRERDRDWRDQSYKYDTTYKFNRGTKPEGFAGFASQVADFFNKQTNGKITFKFTAPATTTTTSTWKTGGVPSTEVGLLNALPDAKYTDFLLYINYGSTTGSLEAKTELSLAKGEVTFDISDILDKLGGATIGTVQDVYYGLGAGYTTDGYKGKGLLVEKVTFEYDDAADAATDADTTDVTDETDVDEDNTDLDEDTDEDEDTDDEDIDAEDTDDTDEDEDDTDAELDDDTDDSDDVANAEDITDPATGDDDTNPGTGVGLAVIPAIVAAAAAVVSKKRK